MERGESVRETEGLVRGELRSQPRRVICIGADGHVHRHRVADGDRVVVASPELGSLVNRMRPCDACEPWTFGASHLMRNLARRGLL